MWGLNERHYLLYICLFFSHKDFWLTLNKNWRTVAQNLSTLLHLLLLSDLRLTLVVWMTVRPFWLSRLRNSYHQVRFCKHRSVYFLCHNPLHITVAACSVRFLIIHTKLLFWKTSTCNRQSTWADLTCRQSLPFCVESLLFYREVTAAKDLRANSQNLCILIH
jgi:hypothetical protein